MGLLVKGVPLDWPKSLEHLKYVREHGVLQFINLYKSMLTRSNDVLLWGDEIEYMIVKFDQATGKATLSLKATSVIEALEAEEAAMGSKSETAWRPEYGEWMVEAVPSNPYGGYTVSLQDVERNIRLRQQRIQTALAADEHVLSIVSFPTMGVGMFTHPPLAPGGNVSMSDCVPDGCINPHPRFATLTANIRQRRGSKVNVQVPLFRDQMTPEYAASTATASSSTSSSDTTGQSVFELDMGGDVEFQIPTAPSTASSTTPPPSPPSGVVVAPQPTIDMDCMAFGMGCCCLQVTFQARNLTESRQLYDQLAVLAPMMLALTAGCPILKGRLADTDVRWNVIAGSVDDRTPAERQISAAADPAKEGESERGGTVDGPGNSSVQKSRYDSIDLYISNSGHFNAKYNDVETEVDEPSKQMLLDAGIDDVLANHIGRLFIRDPLVIFENYISELDDAESSDHFENIQSTNWQSVRWKPPPVNSSIGWRVEFRSMEAQLTSYENAAYTVFIGLVSRVILFFDLNLYMPMSKVHLNMETAHQRKAVTEGMFYFRRNVVPLSSECGPDDLQEEGESKKGVGAASGGGGGGGGGGGEGEGEGGEGSTEDEVEQMSILEILMGKKVDSNSKSSSSGDKQYFPGLMPLINAYLDIIDCDAETRFMVEDYIDFICKRASGDLVTTAEWMRNFVSAHPDYKFDSIVSEKIAFDLLEKCVGITQGTERPPELFGKHACVVEADSSAPTLKVEVASDSDSDSGTGGRDINLASLLPPRRMLRGSSFREEVKTIAQCSLVRALIAKYSSKALQHRVRAESGFANTKAFLTTAMET